MPLEIGSAFAALSVVAAGSGDGSHFSFACRSLATQGFRPCSLVLDKLGLSVRTDSDEQVDFQWGSVSDVQDPRLKAGLQACAVTVGVREPARLDGAPVGALALVLRLPDPSAARKLADAALAFKAYEAQTALRMALRAGASQGPAAGGTALLLDERGCAYWSLGEAELTALAAAKTHLETIGGGVIIETAVPVPPCCQFCWC